ncbi:hypothetical protein B0H11DRAFT_2080222 [Mycena galericulata]|nr:hypothetical protein B0H11DRAFT_2080222 [Mycena galericulata]
MSSPKTFLFLGATGYIGGSILSKLLQHPRASEFQITALVRDSAKAEKLTRFGVTPIVGDNSKLDLLESLARDADIVISVAESTNIPATKATLSGAKTRYEATGISTIYIHTSGAGAIADCTVNGMHPHFTTYDDLDAAQMAAIAPEQLHRPVDLELLNADDEGYIRSYIVLPSTVYGIATGPLVECGIQKRQTTVLPWLVKASLTRGQGGMVGQGRNVWSNVELYDLADLYIVLYDAIMSDIQPAHGREGLYFAENGAHELREISAIVAQVLCEHGKGENVIPTTFTAEEEVKYFGPLAPLIGSNAKCTASRPRALGWRPTNSTSALMASVRGVTTRMICGNDL